VPTRKTPHLNALVARLPPEKRDHPYLAEALYLCAMGEPVDENELILGYVEIRLMAFDAITDDAVMASMAEEVWSQPRYEVVLP
jgi:hypothetical protein